MSSIITIVVVSVVSIAMLQSIGVNGLPTNITSLEDEPNNRIVGGSSTRAFQYPWLALLSFSSSNDNDRMQRHCGGSLIHPNYVMTAAHCTFRSGLHVVVNRYDLSDSTEPSERFDIKSTFRHPKYNNNLDDSLYDIALLKLSRNATTKPVPLASSKSVNMTNPGTMLTVAGWGTMRYGVNQMPNKLQQVDVPVVGISECQKKYAQYKISHLQICAGDTVNGGEDSCQGDSGGPLFFDRMNPRVIGIVSYGIGCGQASYPGVYTNVIEMLPWITSIIPKDELIFDDEHSGIARLTVPVVLVMSLFSTLGLLWGSD